MEFFTQSVRIFMIEDERKLGEDMGRRGGEVRKLGQEP
jgi:hypothetical protein